MIDNSLREKVSDLQWQRCLVSFSECPRVLVSMCNSKKVDNGVDEMFLAILKTPVRSARFLHSSRDHNFSFFNRSV